MNNTRKWFPLAVFILATTIFFIYYLFPSDIVKSYLASNLNAVNPDINITIDHVRPTFPPGLKLYDVILYYLDDVLINAEQIKIVPNFLSLFRSKIVFLFKGNAFDGTLKGRGTFIRMGAGQDVLIEGDFSGLQMKRIPAITYLAGHQLIGRLEGNFTYRGGGKTRERVETRLVASDVEFELATPVFKLGRILFSKIEADMTMENQKLRVKRCILKGDPMEGSISGYVTLKSPPGQSYLKLSGVIKPNREFIAKLEKDLPPGILSGKIYDKRVVRIRIYGMLDQPRFFLN